MPDAVMMGGAQHAGTIINQQGSAFVIGLDLLQGVPELHVLLGESEIMGADDPVQILVQPGAGQFKAEALAIGIGDQDPAVMTVTQFGQKVLYMGANTN